MNDMSTYLKNKVLTDNLQSVYAALFNGEGEITEASYARKSINFVIPENGQTSNDEDVFFPIAEEGWGDITDIGIYDGPTSGNLLFKSPAEFTKTIDISSQYKIPKNYLIIRLK